MWNKNIWIKAKAEEELAGKGGVENPKLTEEEVEGQAKAKKQAGGLKFDKVNITGKNVEAFEGRAKSGWRGSRKSRWRYQKMSLGKVVTNFMGSNLHPKFLPKVAKKRQKKPKVDFPHNYSTKAVK